MEDIEIKKAGIVIVEWLRPEDENLGRILFDDVVKKESEKGNYFVKFYSVDTKDQFLAVLQKLVDTTEEGTMFTLHITSHGNEDGIGLDGNDFVCWKEFFNYTRQLNVKMHNTLLIVLSSCVGGGILSYIEPEKRAPYMAFIGNTRSVFIKDAKKGFNLFYEDFYYPQDFRKCLDKMNGAIDFTEELNPGFKKTKFFLMTAMSSFDDIFNPDRDLQFFNSIVDKLMPPTPDIPQELRREKAKELFRKKAEELRPYFTFTD